MVLSEYEGGLHMWNADIYNKYGKERMQPSMDLVHRISLPIQEHSGCWVWYRNEYCFHCCGLERL